MRIPQRHDVGIGSRGKDAVGLEAAGGEGVAGVREQLPGARLVAGRSLQRHHLADREPGGAEIDQRAVLVEQDSLDRQAPHSVRQAWIWRTSPDVEAPVVAASALPSTTGNRPVASSLPSSTPHWSNE